MGDPRIGSSPILPHNTGNTGDVFKNKEAENLAKIASKSKMERIATNAFYKLTGQAEKVQTRKAALSKVLGDDLAKKEIGNSFNKFVLGPKSLEILRKNNPKMFKQLEAVAKAIANSNVSKTDDLYLNSKKFNDLVFKIKKNEFAENNKLFNFGIEREELKGEQITQAAEKYHSTDANELKEFSEKSEEIPNEKAEDANELKKSSEKSGEIPNEKTDSFQEEYLKYVNILEEIKNTSTNLMQIYQFVTDNPKEDSGNVFIKLENPPENIANEFIDALKKANETDLKMSSFTFRSKTVQVNDINRKALEKLHEFFSKEESSEISKNALVDILTSKIKGKEEFHILKPLRDAMKDVKDKSTADEIGRILVGELSTKVFSVMEIDLDKIKRLLLDPQINEKSLLVQGIKSACIEIQLKNIRIAQTDLIWDLKIERRKKEQFRDYVEKYKSDDHLDLDGIIELAQLAKIEGIQKDQFTDTKILVDRQNKLKEFKNL